MAGCILTTPNLWVFYIWINQGEGKLKNILFSCDKCAKMNSTYSTVSKIGNI